MESDKFIGKLARWALILHEYDFQVVHRPGVTNLDADGLRVETHELTRRIILELDVATPLWPSVRVKPNTPKVGDWESSGTPECLEFDSKAQNTSH
jgi:hypothetical protein